MRTYRIYAERFGVRSEITSVVRRYFSAFTVYSGQGFWKGGAEDTDIIEIIDTEDQLQYVVHLAGDLKELGKQSEVLVTSSPVTVVKV